MKDEVLLRALNLTKTYAVGKSQTVHALRGISLHVNRGETLAIVGESGCGKSTLARILVGLEKSDAGSIQVLPEGRSERIPMVFQDSLGSLHPRRSVANLIVEPLLIAENRIRLTAELRALALQLAQSVGLSQDHLDRLPHELSGGQRQRVNLARALASFRRGIGAKAIEGKIVLLDEPLSALDVSIQAQILNLLMDLQDAEGLSIIFISHDLSVVRHFAHRTMVLYMGEVVESGPTEEVLRNPWHPYTRALIAADPSVGASGGDFGGDSGRGLISGEPPSPFDVFKGCPYASRCSAAEEKCRQEIPKLETFQTRAIACLPRIRELKQSHGNSPALS